MFWLYDQVFFNNIFRRLEKEKGFKVTFKFSKRTGAAAVCRSKGNCEFVIEISLPVYQAIFQPGTAEVEKANGINCESHIECLQLVMEHEMIHALIRALDIPTKMSHGPEFQKIARGLFGHTDFRHSLGLGLLFGKEEAKNLIKVGDRVRSKDKDGSAELIVTKVNKGARGANYNGYRVDDPKKKILVAPYGTVMEINGQGPTGEEDYE